MNGGCINYDAPSFYSVGVGMFRENPEQPFFKVFTQEK